MCQWVRFFKERKTDNDDESRSRRPSVMSDYYLVKEIDDCP